MPAPLPSTSCALNWSRALNRFYRKCLHELVLTFSTSPNHFGAKVCAKEKEGVGEGRGAEGWWYWFISGSACLCSLKGSVNL